MWMPASETVPPGPMGYDDMCELHDLSPTVPLGQAQESVHTEDHAQRSVRELRA